MPRALSLIALGTLALAGCGPAGDLSSAGPPAASSAIPRDFHALGTEPFWGMTVTGQEVRYATPEITESLGSDVVRGGGAMQQSLSGRLGEVPFALTVRAGRCSDGMSDRVYPFTAYLRIGDRDVKGCAAAK